MASSGPLRLCIVSVILFVLLIQTKIAQSKTQRFNSAVGFRKDWCPEICKLTEETHSCTEVSKLKHTLNISEVCSTFLAESFSSLGECEEKCSGCALRKMLTKCTTRNLEAKFAICKLKPKTGLCRGYFVNWYYDENLGDCSKFIYGGCGGNKNNFRDHQDCMLRCGLLGVLYPKPKVEQLTHVEL